ncbi:DedA family protein [Helicobacter anseris]|uniref:DedA family protein n=1 Tax=Helicobacter anseris TaxID=375926 RepID=A0A3D8JB50_9HELI|nr:DedA family protein [Helicobacter anseris]RDU74540.1 DedA family protein [Helicobacter anseris]
MDTIQSFQENLQNWGYLLLFLYSLGGGYVAIVAAGFLSSLGSMDITLSICTAFLGNTIGSSVISLLIRNQKKDFLVYVNKHRRKLALGFKWLRAYGVGLIFFSKYLYGIKTIVPMAVGISKYSLKKYLFFNVFACLLWALVVGLSSYFASEFVRKIFINFSILPSYAMPLFLIAIGSLFFVLLKIYSKKK